MTAEVQKEIDITIRTAEIETTIFDIHAFFTDWVGGRCPGYS